jgi:hypothetical protein
MERIIRKIEPVSPLPQRKKVAAYARVSAGSSSNYTASPRRSAITASTFTRAATGSSPGFSRTKRRLGQGTTARSFSDCSPSAAPETSR